MSDYYRINISIFIKNNTTLAKLSCIYLKETEFCRPNGWSEDGWSRERAHKMT